MTSNLQKSINRLKAQRAQLRDENKRMKAVLSGLHDYRCALVLSAFNGSKDPCDCELQEFFK